MIKRLAGCVREYKKPTVLTLIFIVCEVIIEVFIPFITADMVNGIKAGALLSDTVRTGLLLIVMACLSRATGRYSHSCCSTGSVS